MRIYIKDDNVLEALSLLKSIRRILMNNEGASKEDLAPEILTINDFINQIQYKEVWHSRTYRKNIDEQTGTITYDDKIHLHYDEQMKKVIDKLGKPMGICEYFDAIKDLSVPPPDEDSDNEHPQELWDVAY